MARLPQRCAIGPWVSARHSCPWWGQEGNGVSVRRTRHRKQRTSCREAGYMSQQYGDGGESARWCQIAVR